MPPSKKNGDIKTPSQKQTLHNFFNGASATRNAPATKSRHSKSTNAKQSTRNISHQEIIVIDSDSDDDVVEFVETLNTKKRRLSPKCTDHTSNLDPLLHEQTAFASGSSSGSKASALPIVSKALVADTKNNATSTKSDQTSFGTPLLLMPPRLEETSKGLSSSFGNPYLLGPLTSQNSVSSRPGPCASEQSSSVRPMENNSLELDSTLDSWENRDDEDVEFITEDVYGIQENETLISGCDDGTVNRSNNQHDDGLDSWDNVRLFFL
jgi:glycosyltransferase involved in cell wall biosynthesis